MTTMPFISGAIEATGTNLLIRFSAPIPIQEPIESVGEELTINVFRGGRGGLSVPIIMSINQIEVEDPTHFNAIFIAERGVVYQGDVVEVGQLDAGFFNDEEDLESEELVDEPVVNQSTQVAPSSYSAAAVTSNCYARATGLGFDD